MNIIDHHIEKHIIKTLAFSKSARFAQMRPLKVDSNLYSYHLNKLLKHNYIIKTERDYSLSAKGLTYVDKLSFADNNLTSQPKINTGILLKNEFNEILLTKRLRQPLLDFWGLPMGKLHSDDTSIVVAARRELHEKTGIQSKNLNHIGDCYLRYMIEQQLVSVAFAHIFYSEASKDSVHMGSNMRWEKISGLGQLGIIPSVVAVVDLTLEQKERFFAEITFDDKMVHNITME